MSVEPLRRAEGGAVVAHSDITRRKRDEIALRESEDRFRRLADALPHAIWMSDVTGACTYVNSRWVEFTGRSLEQELGDGWMSSLHRLDRKRCEDAYVGVPAPVAALPSNTAGAGPTANTAGSPAPACRAMATTAPFTVTSAAV